MKSTVADYRTRVYCVRIEPVVSGAQVLRFSSHPMNLVMGGQTYSTDSGFEFTGYNATARMSPDTVDLEGIVSAAGIDRAEIAAGVYNNARVYVFATSWAAPVEDEEPLAKYFFGKATVKDDRYIVQLMGLIDALGQTQSNTCKPSCRNQLGDARCGINLDALEEAAAIQLTVDQLGFQVDSTQVNDWYAYGTVEFTSGENAGLGVRKIKSHDDSGNITLFHPFQKAIAVGDQVVLRPGCRKRFQEDCITKFNNGPQFGGFPHVPTKNQSSQWGTK